MIVICYSKVDYSSSLRSQATPGDPIGFSEQEVQGLAIP